MQAYARLGIFGMLALVALRVGIGWHFYMEGASKLQSRNFSSEGFVTSAKGPLAGSFHALIWDKDGQIRLNEQRMKGLFDLAAKNVVKHFSLTGDQQKDVDKLKTEFIAKLDSIYADGGEDVYKYINSTDRIKKMAGSPMWNKVASLRGQMTKIETDNLRAVQPTLQSIDTIWDLYERRLNGVANKTQQSSAGRFTIVRPDQSIMNIDVVDTIIPYFDLCIGICLILGLFTPLAAGLGGLFLVSVVLSQMPGYPDTQPTYFQAVEGLAMFVLMTTGAGRYAGLDFIPWAWLHRKSKYE